VRQLYIFNMDDVVGAEDAGGEMVRCETCRHWEPPGDFEIQYGAHGACRRLQLAPQEPLEPAFIQRAEGEERAPFWVGPEFGCALWGPKGKP
jgi:hypothetical protein